MAFDKNKYRFCVIKSAIFPFLVKILYNAFLLLKALIAQLDRVSVSETEGQRFDPSWARQIEMKKPLISLC